MQGRARDILARAWADYLPTDEWDCPFAEPDDLRAFRARRALSRLPDWERNVLILYAETGSCTETARLLGVSRNGVWRAVRKIRETIAEMMKNDGY